MGGGSGRSARSWTRTSMAAGDRRPATSGARWPNLRVRDEAARPVLDGERAGDHVREWWTADRAMLTEMLPRSSSFRTSRPRSTFAASYDGPGACWRIGANSSRASRGEAATRAANSSDCQIARFGGEPDGEAHHGSRRGRPGSQTRTGAPHLASRFARRAGARTSDRAGGRVV